MLLDEVPYPEIPVPKIILGSKWSPLGGQNLPASSGAKGALKFEVSRRLLIGIFVGKR